MSTDPRLFIGQDLAAGQAVALPKEDTHYLVNVMRRAAGDTVRLFNGRDGEWRAQIVETGRKAAILEPLEQTRPQAGVPDLWLLFAPVKRQKTDLMVEKATELGVARLCPVSTARTQSERVRIDRFRTITKEAAEQTERLDLPEIDELERLDRSESRRFAEAVKTDYQTLIVIALRAAATCRPESAEVGGHRLHRKRPLCSGCRAVIGGRCIGLSWNTY